MLVAWMSPWLEGREMPQPLRPVCDRHNTDGKVSHQSVWQALGDWQGVEFCAHNVLILL